MTVKDHFDRSACSNSLDDTLNRISAIVPVRNGGNELLSAVRIILASISNFDEIIIINDGSTDNSIEAIPVELPDARIKVINSKGSGLVDALNTGISISSNPWLARFDVGDFYNIERLDIQRSVIGPDVVGIFSDYLVEDLDGSNLGYIPTAVHDSALKLSLLKSQRTPHPAALVRKSSVIKAGGYKTTEFPAEDLGLWLRLSKMGKLISVPYPLLIYRLNPNSITGQNFQTAKSISRFLIHGNPENQQDILRICEKAFQDKKEILGTYKHLSMGQERRILFFLDLVEATKVKGMNFLLRIRIFSGASINLFNPFLLPPIFRLYRDKSKRSRKRRLNGLNPLKPKIPA